MAVGLEYDPEYPVVGEEITLTASNPEGTSQEFEIALVPDESGVALERLRDASGNSIDTFTPDVPGQYNVTIHDYRDTGFAPPRWSGDITAQRGKRLLGSYTRTVYVGVNMDLPIVTLLGHGATLRLTIVREHVRVAVLVDPITELSRVVCLQSAVTTAMGVLVGLTVTAMGNNLVTMIGDITTNFLAHIATVSGSVHIGADTVNTMQRSYVSGAASHAYSIVQLNELREKVLGHTQAGSYAPRVHTNDDTVNTPLVGAASDQASAMVLAVDIGYRVYERHRILVGTPAVHGSQDTTNDLAAAASLTLFIVAFLDAIELIAPTAPTGEVEGANDAAHMYGFARALT